MTWSCTLKGLLDIFIGPKPSCCRNPQQWHIHNLPLLVYEGFDILDLKLGALKDIEGLSMACEAPGCSSESLDLIPVSELLLSILQFHVRSREAPRKVPPRVILPDPQ